MSCLLCALEIKTHLYYKDRDITIVDCATCRVPMVVFNKAHGRDVSAQEKAKALDKIQSLFGKREERKYQITTEPRQIKYHPHWHIRPKDACDFIKNLKKKESKDGKL